MQFTKTLVSILTWLCIISITLLTAIVLLQVISRVSDIFVPGTEELARLLIVWLTFLGSSLAIHEKMHLAVNYFVRKVGKDKRKYVHLFVNILLALFYGVLTVYGFRLAADSMSSSSPALQLPMGIFYLALPVSGLFSLYFILSGMKKSPTEDEGGGAV
ncbi:TRAP transporter small permease [Salinicoccus carnicancri]|uniref:TRAP transporter small permease n=1 Tax=Salinicoccus carnicancri TaxID=558170 RepID=UPI0002D7D8EA|nr:TRAP transporter small permease [Salinicoccus carnicancri]